MLHRAYALSCTVEAFNLKCDKLHSIFSHLDYPRALIDSTISNFLRNVSEPQVVQKKTESRCKIRISLPFKDQVAVSAVRKQFRDHKIWPILQPVFVSRKLEQEFKPREIKPSIVNQQCVVYHFSCDLWDTDYAGCTVRHVFQRVTEHKNSVIEKYFLKLTGVATY